MFWGESFQYLKAQILYYTPCPCVNVVVLALQNSLGIWFLDVLNIQSCFLWIDQQLKTT